MFAIPALPQMICAASVCRCTLHSVARQISEMALIDTMMLVRLAQQKEMIFDWIQRPLEDRYRLCASLIGYMELKRIKHPLR